MGNAFMQNVEAEKEAVDARRKWMRVRARKSAQRKERGRVMAVGPSRAAYAAADAPPAETPRGRTGTDGAARKDEDPFKLRELPSMIAQIAGHGKHDLRRWPWDWHGRYRGYASTNRGRDLDFFDSIF